MYIDRILSHLQVLETICSTNGIHGDPVGKVVLQITGKGNGILVAYGKDPKPGDFPVSLWFFPDSYTLLQGLQGRHPIIWRKPDGADDF